MVIDLACHYQKHIVLRGSVTPGGEGYSLIGYLLINMVSNFWLGH